MDFFDGFTFFFAFAFVLPLGLLALVVLVLAGGRDIDPTGKRTVALYVCIVSFVALFTALVASTGVVGSLTEKIKDDDSSASSEGDLFDDEIFEEDFEDFEVDVDIGDGDSGTSENDRVLRGVVQSALVLVVAGGVLLFHHRRRRDYTAEPDFDGSAAWRTDRAYVYAVCFTAILIFLFSTATGAYEVFKLIGPGVFGSGDDSDVRKSALQTLLTLAWLALASGAIFRYYWRQGNPTPPVVSANPGPPTAPAAPPASTPTKRSPAKKAPAKKR
jgi:hypothetical protein